MKKFPMDCEGAAWPRCCKSLLARSLAFGLSALSLLHLPQYTFADEQDPLVKMDLEVGESATIAVPTGTEVKLSRKGLIHLERQDKETFLIVGLKEGYVLILAESSHDRKLFGIFVHPQAKDSSRNTRKASRSNPRTSAESERTGTEAENVIDLAVWLRTLDPRWVDMQGIGSETYLRQVCRDKGGAEGEEAIPPVVRNELRRRKIPQICFLQDQSNHRLDLLVILIKGSESQLWSLQDVLDIVKKQFELERIQARHELRRELVINAPSLVFRFGEQTKFTSGGEMEALATSSVERGSFESESWWKPFGLSFSFEATQLLDSSLELDYEMKLTLPSQQRGRFTLQGASAGSRMAMKKDQYVLLGSFDIQSSSQDSQRDSLYGRIPILWPLFQSQNKQDAFSQIVVLAKITRVALAIDAASQLAEPGVTHQ